MPLDSKRLSMDVITSLKEIPYDEEARSCIHNSATYQTKCEIYDKKCNDCGYMLVFVGKKQYRSVEEAITEAILTGNIVARTCDYPGDVEVVNKDNIFYPSLNMIVMNTCRLWNPSGIEIDEEDN
uniref:Uncharacterized protein n=1 Tax=viral metagenome TaxID=1070528 RepID=A0A6H1ZM61_9ZZZZ